MDYVRTNAKFVGCYRTTRRCYHCGFEMEMVVLDGEELTPPNPSDYCIGFRNHKKHGIFRNHYRDDGTRWGIQQSPSLLKSMQDG